MQLDREQEGGHKIIYGAVYEGCSQTARTQPSVLTIVPTSPRPPMQNSQQVGVPRGARDVHSNLVNSFFAEIQAALPE